MSDYTNEDFLAALIEAQESVRRPGPGSFNEWQEENRFGKAGTRGNPGHYSPGFGLMGNSLNTSSNAPYGPANRPSGNNAVGLKQNPQQFGVPSGSTFDQGQSKYDGARPDQPPPWITDVDLASVWYSPMEPVWPFGPPYYTVPREWNFPVGYNLNYVPQRLELMGMLRGMRQSWGVLSTVIETRKDQLLRLPWTIQVRNKPRATSKAVDQVRKFFKSPDGKLRYSQWARKYLDDLFVIDAPCVYLDRDRGGQLRNAQILDGGTIFPLIDDTGRRPDTIVEQTPSGVYYEKRQPAFQQIIYGLPMINLSEDELMYGMMRPRPELPMFGYSQVEQIMTEATEAIRKTFYQLEFWRAGSMPEMIVTVPEQWTPRQIATFQAHFDALLSGQLTLKSKVRFVPGGMKPFDVKNASGESLWSERDELLVRLCCYAFSVAPTPFVKQTNRSTAGQAQETAEEEGLYPLMCVDAETETLTENGWRRFDQISREDAIATLNLETRQIEYHVPYQKFEREVFSQEMIHFKTQSVDFLATPEHEMIVRSKNATKFSKRLAKDVDFAQFYFFAAASNEIGSEVSEFCIPGLESKWQHVREAKVIPMDAWLEFLGYFIADGGLNSDATGFNLTQSISQIGDGQLNYEDDADPNFDASELGHTRFSAHSCDFFTVLDRLGYSANFRLIQPGENPHSFAKYPVKRWTISDRRMAAWLAENVGAGSANKRIPREFFAVSKRQRKILFAAMMAGDGSWDARDGCDSGRYYTSSRQLADDVQELAISLGFCASMTINSIYSNRFGDAIAYRVDISTRQYHALMTRATRTTPASVSREKYSGVIYCFNVANHTFITRRNGKVAFHGNSYWKDDVMDVIIQEKMGFEDVECVFLSRPEPDQSKQATIYDMQIKEGLRTRNEVRGELGLEPVPDGDYLTVTTGAAVIRLDQVIAGDAMQPGAPAPSGPPRPATPSGAANVPVKGPARPRSASPIPPSPPSPVEKAVSAKAIARAAKQAKRNPNKTERKLGNYSKGHISYWGLSIAIENAKGSKRGEKDRFGIKHKIKMPAAYGYINGTLGADDMQLDCYIGKWPESPFVWIIDQDKFDVSGEDKGFDEHKIFFAYKNEQKAMQDYLSSHYDGLGHERMAAVVQLNKDDFKQWLKKGDMKKPVSEQGFGRVVARRGITKADTVSMATGLLSYDQNTAVRRKRKKARRKKARRSLGPRWLTLVA